MAPVTRSQHRRSQIRDWAHLQMKILNLILQRLLYPDCLNFSKVCRRWRSVFVNRREHSHPPPCILLRSIEGERTLHRPIFYRGIFHEGQLLRNVSPSLNIFERIVGSCFGWLVIASRFTFCMYLLNPTSNERIPLPSLPFCSVLHVDLSSKPTSCTCVVVGRVVNQPNQLHSLVRCRPGGKQWTTGMLQPQDYLQQCQDSVFHMGKLHLLCKNGDTVVCILGPQRIIISQVLINNFCSINQPQFKRLVQSNGQLLLVVHKDIDDRLVVFRNREDLGDEWVRVDNLGDQVLLIGIHGAESVCTKDLMGLTYEPNYIYYWTLNQSVKEYSMIDRKMENIPLVEELLEWVVTKEW